MKNVILCDKYVNKLNPWNKYGSILNPYIFSDIKESSCGCTRNLDNEYQNFLILIALLIASNEGWGTTNGAHHCVGS